MVAIIFDEGRNNYHQEDKGKLSNIPTLVEQRLVLAQQGKMFKWFVKASALDHSATRAKPTKDHRLTHRGSKKISKT